MDSTADKSQDAAKSHNSEEPHVQSSAPQTGRTITLASTDKLRHRSFTRRKQEMPKNNTIENQSRDASNKRSDKCEKSGLSYAHHELDQGL